MKTFETTAAPRSEEERTFEVGGETFVARASVRPEVLIQIEPSFEGVELSDALAAIDNMVLALIEPGDDAQARWRRLRERETDPVSFQTLEQIAAWLVEVASGRPTEAPSLSGDGREQTGTSSTEESPLRAVTSTP